MTGRLSAMALACLTLAGCVEMPIEMLPEDLSMEVLPPDLLGADLRVGPGPLGSPCKHNGECLSMFCHFEPPNTPESKLVCGCNDGEIGDVNGETCVCDPQLCTSCCDLDRNRCGHDVQGGNSCGGAGQKCFPCGLGSCFKSTTLDVEYCAPGCGGGCKGCCSDTGRCLFGDENNACGRANGACVDCGMGRTCVNQRCEPPFDLGVSDGAIDLAVIDGASGGG